MRFITSACAFLIRAHSRLLSRYEQIMATRMTAHIAMLNAFVEIVAAARHTAPAAMDSTTTRAFLLMRGLSGSGGGYTAVIGSGSHEVPHSGHCHGL
jgi:hypothetical protein